MWSEQDNQNQLRTRLAKIIASKVSGLPPDDIRPEQDDYDLADALADQIERHHRRN